MTMKKKGGKIVIKKIARIALAFLGVTFGYAMGLFILKMTFIQTVFKIDINDVAIRFGISSLAALIFGLILFLLSPKLIELSIKITKNTELELSKVPANQILVGSIGLIIGLVIAYLISGAINNIPIPFVDNALSLVAYIFLGYLGVSLATKNLGDFSKLPEIIRKSGSKSNSSKITNEAKPKILDTSVIIDGRISDICKTGFIEGDIIIPEFVLKELRHIADSSDNLKRVRGRRGLDILKVIQQDLDVEVKIVDTDFDDVSEVDIKLLKLAQKTNGMVVTNDYNLNKVAQLQGVPILNINELANAVKPVVIPGEQMTVQIIKEGKESNQGIAYLDDGTMIVVEGARHLINEVLNVTVTSVLQTAAGKMIFAKPNGSNK
jgi:uncharacterized protein YacL